MARLCCVRQRGETDCGAACLATVCRQYGANQVLARIREIAGTDRFGTSAFGLVKAAEELGFSARGVKGTIEGLLAAEDLPLPMIAHVVTDEGMLHYVVIQRIKGQVLTVADPARGIVKWGAMPLPSIGREWSSFSHRRLTACRAELSWSLACLFSQVSQRPYGFLH